jgi:hypothetical protein
MQAGVDTAFLSAACQHAVHLTGMQLTKAGWRTAASWGHKQTCLLCILCTALYNSCGMNLSRNTWEVDAAPVLSPLAPEVLFLFRKAAQFPLVKALLWQLQIHHMMIQLKNQRSCKDLHVR